MAISIDKFFRIWHFLKMNPYPELKQKLKDNEFLYPDTNQLYQKVLNFDPIYDFSRTPQDLPWINAALDAREKSWNYFAKVICPGSYAFNTKDIDLFRKMTIDWNASSRAFKDMFRHASDAFSLPSDDTDKGIRGFGIDFVNEGSLDNLSQRQLFLQSMTELYKIKGTPQSIVKALTFASVNNAVIREYWIERDPSRYKVLRVRGAAIGKYEQTLVTDDSTGKSQYVFNGESSHYDTNYLTWQNFLDKQANIAEPHWWYTSEEIINIEFDPATKLKLPSLTPYFGIDYYVNIEKYNTFMSILEKIMSDQMNSIIGGNRDLVPTEIGMSGYNQDLTEKDLWITGYSEPISIVETFLAFSYCQIRYDEYIQYSNFRDYLVGKGVVVPEFSYPYSYQQLIYWCYQHRFDYVVAGVIQLDSILRMFVRGKSNYYCSTNELIKWWISLDSVNNNAGNVPSIFFDTDYSFQFNPLTQDTSMDQILFYNGPRKLDYKSSPFEYFQTLNDASRSLSVTPARLAYDEGFKSYQASNRKNPYLPTEFDAQLDFRNTYYDYISWASSDYLDKETHEASQVTPYYVGKYPKSIKWNWGIDQFSLFICKSPGRWIKSDVERAWDDVAPVSSNSGPLPGVDISSQIGYQFYYNQYMYKYVAQNTWVRILVETDWNYCESVISPDGYVKATSTLAHMTAKGKIDSAIAQQYLTDKSQLVTSSFNLTVDPLTKPVTSQYNIIGLESFLSTYNLTVSSNGYLVEDFSYYFDDKTKYLYYRINTYDINTHAVSTNTIWVRKTFKDIWELLDNGNEVFVGNYRFPNLDLTNRYDSERLLRGTSVLYPADLPTEYANNGEILVSFGPNGYPQTYIWDTGTQSFVENSVNRINDINLGINNGLIEWIDSSVTSETDYSNYADKFLNTLSSYVKIQFQDSEFDMAGIFKNIRNGGLVKDLINFFKPKRARLLYFSVDLEFADRLHNSIIIDDTVPTTKILHSIEDYVPRNDGIFVSEDNGMYNKAYHEDDVSSSFIIPVNSVYGASVFYANGFEDQRANGFYFNRIDLSENGLQYYMNYQGFVLAYITNDTEIHGYWNQWVITAHKQNIDWCDALYINYHTDPTTANWVTKDDLPINSSSTASSVPGTVFNVADITISDLRECDITKSNNQSEYDIDVINEWNSKHPRPEPSLQGIEPGLSSSSSLSFGTQEKTLRTESRSLRQWPPAICKDPSNFRRIFPTQNGLWWNAAGYPETITGDRIGDYTADSRNSGHNEFNYTFWAKNYPYTDSSLVIKDAAKPIIAIDGRNGDVGLQQQYTSNHISPYISTTRTVSNIIVTSPGSGYSIQTQVVVEGGDGTPVSAYPVIVGGQIISVVVTDGGTGYQWAPKITFSDIYGGSGAGAVAHSVLSIVSITIPSWWTEAPNLYLSGPVFHRPVYLAIQNTIHDCYPCIDLSICCDYYDTGCKHDGPTNPQVTVWSTSLLLTSSSSSGGTLEGQWSPGQYADYNLKNVEYDEFTHHHNRYGVITNLNDIINPYAPLADRITVQQYWESENAWSSTLENPGDTYCTPCDEPLFTPDLSFFTLPENWKLSGVYHNSITTLNFNNPSFNGVWIPAVLNSATNDNDFPVGYVKQTDATYEIVHVFHKESGYYFWELRHLVGLSWVTQLRTEVKAKLHTLADIVDENLGNWRVDQGHFLNGDDVDVVEDRWCDLSVTPTQFIGMNKSQINQVIVNGYTRSSTWVNFAVAPYSKLPADPYYENAPGRVGGLNFEPITLTTGNLYICVESNPNTNTYLWLISNGVEFDWTLTQESDIRPESPSIEEGYYYKNGYLYLFINTLQFGGWVRSSVIESDPAGDLSGFFTGEWNVSNISTDAYRYVSKVLLPVNEDQNFVCGNMVPYKETYAGIRTILNESHCICHVEDKVEIGVYTYYLDEGGDYIKIRTTVPVGSSTREEHRYISAIYESQLPLDSDFDVNTLTSQDYYLLNKYIPFFLLDGANKVTWTRDGTDYYSRAQIVDPADWLNPLGAIPKIQVTPLSKDFGSLEIWDESNQVFEVKNIGGAIMGGTYSFINMPSEPFTSITVPTTYNLATNEIVNITVNFRPESAGSFSNTIHFSGGGSVSAPLQGIGTALLSRNSRVTEGGDTRITENSHSNRITES